MGIFDRAKRAISSNVNSMIDKAEDPRKLVELTLDEMKEQLGRAREDVVAAVGAEKQLRKKCDELKTSVERWEQRAVLAVKAGDDALAREALKQKGRIAEELAATEKHREAALAQAFKMRDDLKQMERKHAELEAKKGTIAAKSQIAKAGGGAENLGATSGSNAFEAFRQMEEKIDQEDAEASAMRELHEDEFKDAELESKFRKLEVESKGTASGAAEVDDELAALKKRVRVK